ncbi:unnamed protein product [Victoria cruziana]
MTVQNKVPASTQPPIFGDSFHRVGPGEERVRTYDERLTYRLALQDLSQPRKEVSPPDGVLAVPLLRHQRIALSWMLQKETASLNCSGGILADDQGLGKTVSMIALILTEKSPSLKTSSQRMVDIKPEPLDLDEEDGTMRPQELKQSGNSEGALSTKPSGSESTASTCKRRPAAGTLVVCPTSVLRQWAEELQNKVAEKAKLSVLIYHGSNRTRDPDELAKYDVVLTTYSIVSMEVPKQPLVDQDDEKRNDEAGGLSLDSFSGKKRKHDHNDKNSKKNKKVAENSETFARPLARVGWFRVILDEAQSIKNHRTQVARACWGLRAKRRWCLSGTPIQNAIDDLYSYFRFLRYDPYAVYKSFCTTIKNPISRSPANGYKKLQVVLQTIMLRRTKGTMLDGEPIIKLPPKSISLKKVDFSVEERDFYSRLEADSREQFKVYADAGTVKQNYVNILLMLLRLRQACDHPKLVKGFDSTAVQRFSLEYAKKIPREKREELLNHLEACLSLCGICNDPPEDAVVTICSHVFCNQCICERLSGDENICPAAHCKNQINVSSVFSRSTLKSLLLDETAEHNISNVPGCELVKKAEKSTDFSSIESSKIRAALDILQTLPEVQQADSQGSSLVRTCDSVTEGCYSEQNSKSLRITEKAIVFSQWTRMLDLLEVPLKNSCINYRRLDGTMSVLARDKAVKDFNSLPEVSVMIMSLKAASLGLNMVAACHVLLLDLWWNPTTEDQAIDRAHRIGQTRPVCVTRLTVKDTVEDRILALQEKKRVMVASAFGEDERGGRQTRLTEDDLKYLFMI